MNREESPPSKKLKSTALKATAMSTAAGGDAPVVTADFTEKLIVLPFVHEFDGDFYYVRRCYERYYDLVKGMLDTGKRCVTVTGSPGIGKSVFYSYFFRRFREEVIDTWIIAAAYKRNKLMGSATVFKDDGKPTKLRSEAAIGDVLEECDGKRRTLLLCDGPPESFHDTQMVVFASPNEEWLKTMRKDKATLFMPLWTCVELQEAASILRSKGQDVFNTITADVIETRFNIFGGVARECFLGTEKKVKKKRMELLKEINKISSADELNNLIQGKENRENCHRVLHLVPDEEMDMEVATTKLASPFVVQVLSRRLLKTAQNNRDQLRQSLEGTPQGASLLGWIFKVGGHEMLKRGCTLQLSALQEDAASDNVKDIVIQESVADDFEMEDLSPATATLGPYHQPKSLQFPSIDSFYLPRMAVSSNDVAQDLIAWNAANRLILFQMTISKTHPVKAWGIIAVLKRLGLLEAVKTNPQRVALVFAVPKSIAGDFKRQEIVPEPIAQDAVRKVKHIGPATQKKLAELGIFTITKLQEEIRNNTLPAGILMPRAVAILEQMRDRSYSDAVAKIPQYVWSLNMSTSMDVAAGTLAADVQAVQEDAAS